MSSKTSHKAMGDTDWLKSLQMFADTGVCPASEGNKKPQKVALPLSAGKTIEIN